MKIGETRNRLKKIIEKKSIILGSKSRVVSMRGAPSKWLLDLRTTFMDPVGLEMIAQLFWAKFEKKLPFQVGGLEAGSVPLVAAIILEGQRRGTPVNGFFVRKERKYYGRQHVIEGGLDKERIIVVDDLMNSGGTLDKVVVALEDVGRKVDEVFVVVNYDNASGRKYLREHNLKISSIFKRKEFRQLVSRASPPEPDPTSRFKLLWRWQPLQHGYFYVVPKSTPAVDDKNIYFGTDTGTFMALDQKTGEEVWSFQTGSHRLGKGIFSQPALHRGRVFFGSYDGNLYCLDTKIGKEIWRFGEGDWIGSSPALAPDLGLVFVGLENRITGKKGTVAAVDIKTGKKVWSYTVKELLHGSPAYCRERGLVAIGTNDSTGLLFDAKTGRKIWEVQFGGPVKHRPAFDPKRNSVIFGSHDGGAHVIDLDTGKEIWCAKTGDVIYSTPLIVGNLAFVTSSDKKIYIIDLNKKVVRKTFSTSGRVLASPRLICGKIYFGSCDGRVYEITKTGKLTGRLQFPERVTTAVSYSPKNKIFYVPTYDNQIFAIKKLK